MRNIILSFFTLALLGLVGCDMATRTEAPLSETHYVYAIDHEQKRKDGVDRIEIYLANSYKDITQVLKAKNADLGVIVLKPVIATKAGGQLGADIYSPYTVNINVSDNKAKVVIDLLRDEKQGIYPAVDQMSKVKSEFDSVARGVAEALEGRIAPADK